MKSENDQVPSPSQQNFRTNVSGPNTNLNQDQNLLEDSDASKPHSQRSIHSDTQIPQNQSPNTRAQDPQDAQNPFEENTQPNRMTQIQQILFELEKEENKQTKLQLIKLIYQRILEDFQNIIQLKASLQSSKEQNNALFIRIQKLQQQLDGYRNKNTEQEYPLQKIDLQPGHLINQNQIILNDILGYLRTQYQYNGVLAKKITERSNINSSQLEKLRVFVQKYQYQQQNRATFKQQVQKFQKMLDGVSGPPPSENTLQKISQKAQQQHVQSQSNLPGEKKLAIPSRTVQNKSYTQLHTRKQTIIKKSITINGQQLNKLIVLRECRSQNSCSSQQQQKSATKQLSVVQDSTKISTWGGIALQQVSYSNIVDILKQGKNLSLLYQTQLEKTIQILTKRLQQQSAKYKFCIAQQNEKIDQLMSKFQELEEFRVRVGNFQVADIQTMYIQNQNKVHNNISIIRNSQSSSTNSQQQPQTSSNMQMYSQLQRLKEENSQFTQICEKSRKQLQSEQRKVQNLEYQIRELNIEKDNLLQEKNSLAIAHAKIKKELETRIQIQEEQLQNSDRKIQQLTLIIQQLRNNTTTSSITHYQHTIIQHQKYIEQLQQQLQQKNQQERSYLDQLQQYKIKIKQLQERLSSLESEYKEKQQRYKYEKSVLVKNNQDLKYMNSILRKDICKIKEIQAKDWDRQYQDNSMGNSHKIKMNTKISNYTFNEQPKDVPIRSKNYSFSNSSTTNNTNINLVGNVGNTNYTPSYTPNDKYTNPLRSSFINTSSMHNPVYKKQNISSSIIFMSNSATTNNGSKDKNFLFDAKLNLDFTNTNKRHNVSSKTHQEVHYNTERPITQIVKKKYQL